MVFPIVSTIVGLLVAASFFVPMVFIVGPDNLENPPIWTYVATFCYYIVSYFIVIFFNAGLIYCANENLHGRPAKFADGFRVASSRLGAILVWAVISATVGTVLKMISENFGVIGSLVIRLMGAAWTVVTFFTVPMMVIEKVGPVDALKGSWDTIKKTWGETVVGNAGISLAMTLLFLIPIPFFIALCFTGSIYIIASAAALTVLYYIVLGTVGAAMSGIYQTALFSYARTGQAPTMFTAEYIQTAFVPKKTKNKAEF